MTETELAAHVIAWLQAEHWDVYPEVSAAGHIADIVAVTGKPRRGWVIECKTSLSFAVLEQAYRWRNEYAHYVSVAVPGYDRTKRNGRQYFVNKYAQHCIRRDGIGILRVDGDGRVTEDLPAKLNRRPSHPLSDRVHEGHKMMGIAGSASSQRWTRFKETVENLQYFVAGHPGCTLKEAIDGISHHYVSTQSARGALMQWIGTPSVPGIEMRREGKAVRLYVDATMEKRIRARLK